MQLAGPARVVVDAVHRELRDEAGVHPQQPGIDHVEIGKLVGMLSQQARELAQAALLLERRQEPPPAVIECLARGLNGPVDIGCGA